MRRAARFVVRHVSGGYIAGNSRSGGAQMPEFYVLDRAYNGGVVVRLYQGPGRSFEQAQRLAEEKCAELNAKHGPWPE